MHNPEMEGGKKHKSALSVHKGIHQPPSINPDVLNGKGTKKRKKYSVDEFVSGILSGNRTILSQAITLAESSLPQHYETIQEIIEECLPFSSKSVRIGITGVPGVGKSTFIETFGLYIATTGRKVAVLAVDPSSNKSRGSILGDKTRMEKLSTHPDAYIRPSPSAGTLGGVTRKTRETIILCEAAGFDTILVETVGVGQSETAVHSMIDFFLLLLLAGSGDDLQGIKRGIMEMADAVVITKADGENRLAAKRASVLFRNALQMFPVPDSGWKPEVLTCSAIDNSGIGEIWRMIMDYVAVTKKSGYFDDRRKQQAIIRMHDTITEYLTNSFYKNKDVIQMRTYLEQELYNGKITSYKAAQNLIDKYYKK
jgi:LAO/AO transport system kinase